MNELTPMQEAIQMFKDAQKHIISNTEFAKGYDGAITDVITNLEKLLPKEKQVIEENEILLDEIHACIGNEYRLPFWIETKLNNRFKNEN